MKYKQVALGGTFDLFHKGHKALLCRAFSLGEKVFIGIADFKTKQPINTKDQRIKELTEFLRENNYLKRAEIVELTNPCGPTIENPLYEAVVVSEETVSGAKEINRIRSKKGFKQLEIIIIPMEKDENGEIISSTRIRNGDIDRQGMVYQNLFKKNIIISKKVRAILKKPQGKLLTNGEFSQPEIRQLLGQCKRWGNERLVILVGDSLTRRFLDEKLCYDIAIIDLIVERIPQKLFTNQFLKENVKYVAVNKPGTIASDLAGKIKKLIKKERGVIRVIGEEDLAATPVILLSSLKTLVLYGQPKKGVVMIEVTEKVKEKLVKIIKS